MGTNQDPMTMNDGWETLRNLLEKTEGEVRRELRAASPVVGCYLRVPMESAMRAFDGTMRSISNSSEKEQVEMLRTYHSLLTGQMGFVEARLRELDQRALSTRTELTQEEIWRAARRAFAIPSGPGV